MVNVNKLRGKIVECGLNTSELANLIGNIIDMHVDVNYYNCENSI